MKPGDFFLGAIDFFSTLVPGAIATFFLMNQTWISRPRRWPVIERGSPEAWVVFLVSAYVVGHLIAALGSTCLDRLYDRFYARWRRALARRATPVLADPPWRRTLQRLGDVVRKSTPDDALLASAKALKRQQLNEIAKAAGLAADEVSNTYWWAGTVVRARIPSAAAEIEALSAQSKLFRSVTVILPFAAFWAGHFRPPALATWAALLVLCLWRFLRLRWDATERTYEYFIASTLPPAGREEAGPNMTTRWS